MCKRDLLLDHEKFYSYLNENKVTHLNATPSFLHQYNLSKIKHLRRLCVSGEAFSEAFYKKITNEFNVPILNGYGPTECSIGSIVNLVSQKKDNIYSIGSLVSNLKCYLLNKNKQLVPIGALGELYLGGVGVTKGYLNRDDLTSERFISNPFQSDLEKMLGKNERLYKTGDLMRWLENNDLQFIGRNDLQFKIRGYRIELAEIENCITSFKNIQQSCVIPKENKLNNKFLVAFYTSGEQIDEKELTAYVKLKLPSYMQPSLFRRIESMPLTANGKLNIQQLAQIDIFANLEQKKIKMPSNELESRILKIWSTSLGIEQENISIDDEFEKLGGTSLLVCTITEQLQHDLNLKIQPIDIFKLKTIHNLSKQFLTEFLENKGNNKLLISQIKFTLNLTFF
jgi:N-(5-amino-5-carboxypentanoyl)-L-cysteinyl-D-valine synthase